MPLTSSAGSMYGPAATGSGSRLGPSVPGTSNSTLMMLEECSHL